MTARGRLFSFVAGIDAKTRDEQESQLFEIHEPPRVASRPGPEDDLAQRFRHELEALGGEWLEATSDVETVLTPWLQTLSQELGRPPRVAVDPQLVRSNPELLACLQNVGCEVPTGCEVPGTVQEVPGTVQEVPGTVQEVPGTAVLANMDLGITLTDVAIAETGTLVETPRPRRPRAMSLLPPHHLAILPRGRLVPGLEDFFDRIDDDFGDVEGPFASYFTWISGPSRTADIEKVLTVGVHGPGRLTVLLAPS